MCKVIFIDKTVTLHLLLLRTFDVGINSFKKQNGCVKENLQIAPVCRKMMNASDKNFVVAQEHQLVSDES